MCVYVCMCVCGVCVCVVWCVCVYQGRRFAFNIGGDMNPVTIHIAYRISYFLFFSIVCLSDNNYTIMILWTNNISIRVLGVLKG